MPVDREVVLSKISDVLEAVTEVERITSKPQGALSRDERSALRYQLIVLAESLVGLCTHICVEEYGVLPATYREAVRTVAEQISSECSEDLESLVGLRNLLIQRYWVISDSEIYNSVSKDF